MKKKKSILVSMGIFVPVLAIFTWYCAKQNDCSTENLLSPRGVPQTATIHYENCTADGCSFTFQCKPLTKTQTLLRSVNKLLVNSAKADENTGPGFAVTSMTTIGNPALLQTSPGKVWETNWFIAEKNLIPCSESASSIKCTNFAPIADHFLMEGLYNGRPVSLDITVDTSITDMVKVPAGQVKACGQYGINSNDITPDHFTTVQRMYDCSKKVTDFAGIGNGRAQYAKFEPGKPDKNWFLVSCIDVNQDKCAWLSPAFDQGIKFLNNSEEYISLAHISNPQKINTLKSKRVLWSGVLQNTYNYFEANGNGGTYDNYPYVNGATGLAGAYCEKQSFETGKFAPDGEVRKVVRPCYFGTAIVSNQANQCPTVPTPRSCTELKFEYNSDIYKLYHAVNHTESICNVQKNSEPAFAGLANLDWQLPTYPLLLLSTGGINLQAGINPTYEWIYANHPEAPPVLKNTCENGLNTFLYAPETICLNSAYNTQAYTWGYFNAGYHGQNATDPLPAFRSQIWSSSFGPGASGDSLTAWSLGYANVQLGFLSIVPIETKLNVRCVSTVW